MKDRDVYLMQAGLKAIGFDPGPLDGDRGPKTNAARDAWLASLTPAKADSIASYIVDFAKNDLSIRETDGSNRGPGIEKYWGATTYKDGYKNREPYCAAAVCYWVMSAVGGQTTPFPLPRSPLAYDFQKWGKANSSKGVQVLGRNDEILPGDIIVFEFSHVGIAEAQSPRTRDVQTIEANTSPTSTNNEGGGVYRRTRSRNSIRAVVRITT